jgi:malate dehydrogenase (oxaloacetate-decarboxylating)
VSEAVSEDELNANYIIPSVFHPEVHHTVAAAVRAAAEAPR